MDDLIEDDGPGAGPNTPEYTVGEISGAVKRTLEGAFGRVRVRGEVGRVVIARSGHLYFDVKDDRAVLASVCWKGQVARLAQRPEEGMEVVVTGRLTTFGSQSKYQITVEEVEPAGIGALMAMLEKRRAALAAEGLFDAARKRPLPYLPRVIGVVTSPSGAVIRDILHRLADRFPRRVLVWPVAVQGRDCAAQVARAIEGFNALPEGGAIPRPDVLPEGGALPRPDVLPEGGAIPRPDVLPEGGAIPRPDVLPEGGAIPRPDVLPEGGAIPRPDVLIVARGGGSIEDLWGFNEDIVVRAAAASRIPLISAVGHETDTTLIDLAADRRAPTPTAAAEMAVPVRLDLVAQVEGLGARASGGLARGLRHRRARLDGLARGLPRPAALLDGPRQRLDLAAMRLPAALRAGVRGHRLTLATASAALRPATLAARLDRARDRLRAARLRPDLVTRPLDRGAERLDDRARRLRKAAGRLARARADRLAALERLLGSLSYHGTLARGYAVVRDSAGALVTGASDAAAAARLDIAFADGSVAARPEADAAPAPRRRRPPKASPGTQGSLF